MYKWKSFHQQLISSLKSSNFIVYIFYFVVNNISIVCYLKKKFLATLIILCSNLYKYETKIDFIVYVYVQIIL